MQLDKENVPISSTYHACQYDHYIPQVQELKLRLPVKHPDFGPNQVRSEFFSAAISSIGLVK
ncbi:hypothetical protein KXD40_007664 [Peronospora effusa]|uniref:Uncharacterized protein n=1 Tax=Peronospora effusa TaxID=542832 RepID=A0A3M6VS70_9STRA|nr:hypothetical protein DD238_003337 [Peronospora effusa]RQM18624.1 hypothetical protein DD237_001574 [Peronospora effusa]UIZ23634.1 hypothetical protein KXD40_007664 [Peronospora effusa]